ncbi:MAG: 2-oxo acid dehydrogenase subunit E2 [Gemmatimonadaceae bacterium]|nr:2-oxo acid dehydrogenase subunit E2 [Gemmatimonadaceae bacterium]
MTDLIDVTVPVGQAEGTESVVSTWFKTVGEVVSENEPLLEISTDKVNMEVAAPGTGRLSEILKQEGEQFEPGAVLGRIEVGEPSGVAAKDGAGASPKSSPEPDATERSRPVTAAGGAGASSELSPAVRRLLKEHDLDASQIAGRGKSGRITHQDVLDFLAREVASDVGIGGAFVADTADFSRPGAAPAKPAIPGRLVPHTQMRRSIAQHMVQSVATAPHVTSVFDADLSAMIAHRDAHGGDFESRGAKLTYTAYFVQAAVEALKEVPEANGRWQDDGLVVFDDINVGIATALGSGGLIVPVITKAQDLDLFGIARRLQDLTERARSAALDPREVQNGTFTISNHGVSGSLIATPIIINQPQSAILGVGKVERRVVAEGSGADERMVVKPMCYVTLTIDHRVLDGFQANKFLTKWVQAVEGF